MKKTKNSPSGLILYSKKSGITSFSSLWSIKHALGTEKVGHTGTLDSFADGLLVVLSGSLTHIVPHITSFKKTYRAVVCFGKETDTLDPTGNIIKEGKDVLKNDLLEALKCFSGALLQTPPVYSAVHVGGKRASDAAREGKEVFIEPRQIFIYKNELLDFKESSKDDTCSYALLEITCSKGTYIRSLARDIANALGSCGHLCALRRTEVGPFKLEDACCTNELEEFSIEQGIKKEKYFQSLKNKNDEKRISDGMEKILDIKNHFIPVSPELALKCGFYVDILKEKFTKPFLNGRPLIPSMFEKYPQKPLEAEYFNIKKQIAVFYEDESFVGMIQLDRDSRLSYSFVVHPQKKEFTVIKWDDVLSGKFPVEWLKKGISLTVGNFEAVHKGHKELIHAVYDAKDFVPGVFTFSESTRNSKPIFTLDERLELIKELGVQFVILADFTQDFASVSGRDFIKILKDHCGLKFLAEGNDFKCGSGGKTDMEELKNLSAEFDFELCVCDDVLYEGKKISTTRIRSEIEKGNFSSVSKMLERLYEIQ